MKEEGNPHERKQRRIDISVVQLGGNSRPHLGSVVFLSRSHLHFTAGAEGIELTRPVALQDLEARLWQDPYGVAWDAYRQTLKAAPAAAKGIPAKTEATPETTTPETTLQSLQKAIEEATKEDEKLLIMPVLIPGGSYAEQAELRRRARYAVVSGLAVAGFVPVDQERIGYFCPGDQPGLKRGLMPEIVPFEFFRPIGGRVKYTSPKRFKQVLVCWLQSDLPAVPSETDWRAPIHQVALLSNLLWKNDLPKSPLYLRVIGPRTSTELSAFYEELVRARRADSERLPDSMSAWVKGARFFAATPTVPDEIFSVLLEDGFPKLSARQLSDARKSNTLEITLERTIATDDEIIEEIIKELDRRHIDVKKRKDHKVADHIALLTEWDTLYGRALPYTFAQKAGLVPVQQTLKKNVIAERTPFGNTIHYRSYLRGIDGRRPGDTGEKKTDKESETRKPPQEATEGDDQSDYLRRMADDLQKLDRKLRSENGEGLKAVGVLGSDVYDVLMILRALRKVLPEAVFFTNNYDARLGLRDELSATRNLVVVSPFGPTLHEDWQRYVSPFRDSYQTSVFAATLAALDFLPLDTLKDQTPRVFEIGRDGFVDLQHSQPVYSKKRHQWDSLYPQVPTVSHLFKNAWLWFAAFAAVVSLICYHSRERSRLGIVARPQHSPISAANAGSPSTLPPSAAACFQEEILSDTWLASAAIVTFSFFVVCALAHNDFNEPLYYSSGISIWPTQVLRTIASLAAWYFIFKGFLSLNHNRDAIVERFALSPCPKVPSVGLLARIKRAYLPWDSTKWNKQPRTVDGEELWNQYLAAGRPSQRFIRTATYSLLYVAVCLLLMKATGWPRVPARGDWALTCDHCFLVLAIASTVALVMFVYDATNLHCDFIRLLNQGQTDWPPAVRSQFNRTHFLGDSVRQYLDIRLIADRSEVVSRLIYYPFIVVLIMIASRITCFDAWTWPVGLIIIFAANLVIATHNALKLYTMANESKRQALECLRHERHDHIKNSKAAAGGTADKHDVEVFDETIAEIVGMTRGAFAPFWEQPVVRSILYSSGGIGLGSLLQTLPKFF